MRNNERSQLLDTVAKRQKDINYLVNKPRGAEREAKKNQLIHFFPTIKQALKPHKAILSALPSTENFLSAVASEDFDYISALLARLRATLQNEPLQFKVVFLPYLAQTWDALESIYEAFAKDERFITDIIIIPTHRNTPSGRVSLYEDFLAGTGIAHTLYTDYNLATDQPDIVFANNPFDELVDPQFYAARIRQYCKMLVYVPYYGILSGYLNEPRPKAYNTPMQLLADKLIVQSQLTAEAYNRYCPGPQERYLPLGTPKIDACKIGVAKAAQAPQQGWVDKIAGRPVFLLDTHYNIPNDRRVLPDGTSFYYSLFFAMFILHHAYRNPEMFLIWRPHPLTERILNSYYAANDPIRASFTQIMRFASTVPNCIIDQRDDFFMSFALSTAFVSLSRGSLKYDYLALNKPVLYCHYEDDILAEEKRLIASNEVCYTPPHLKLVCFLFLYALQANLNADAVWRAEEEKLLASIDARTQTMYYDLIAKNRNSVVLNQAFLDFIKHKTPDPILGYAKESFAFCSSYRGALTVECVKGINQFEVKLHERHTTKWFGDNMNMIASGANPLQEIHRNTYRASIANADTNCGEQIYRAVTDDFFTHIPAPAAPVANHKHKGKNRR